jgi:hypothetical protein
VEGTIVASHRDGVVCGEEKAGEIDGLKFDRTRHVSTLSFVQQDGIPWLANH